jgi:hypothetical protein
MSAEATNELREFHRFLGEKVNNGGAVLTPEDALDEWRDLHPDPADIAAIQEAIEDMENGDVGIPLQQFHREFRTRHNLPPKS